jgi:hypothetical protein
MPYFLPPGTTLSSLGTDLGRGARLLPTTDMMEDRAPVLTQAEVEEDKRRADSSWAVATARVALAVVYVLVAILAALVVWQLVVRQSERHIVAWSVGAIFVGATVPLALHEVLLHLLHWRSPLQTYYCRILLMAPLYAVEAWLALRFREQAVYFTVARELYEALVIRDFYTLLMYALSNGSGRVDVVTAKCLAAGKRETHMLAPLCNVRPWRVDNGEFFRKTRVGVFQYVVVRSIMAVATFLAEWNGTLGEGSYSFRTLYVYNVVILNASQFVAMWSLLSLYHECADLLEPIKPLGKFLSVKAVVFLSFWQSMLLSALVSLGILTGTTEWSTDEVATGLQDLLICIEMCGAAIAHHYTFSVEDFLQERHMAGALGPRGDEGHAKVGGTGLAFAASQLLPADLVTEAGHHAAATGEAVGEALGALAAGAKNAVANRKEHVWTTSGGGGAEAAPGEGPVSFGDTAYQT